VSLRTATFLREHRDEILRAWEEAISVEPREVRLDGPALRDGLPLLLDELADWLEGAEEPGAPGTRAAALRYAGSRLQDAYQVGQLIDELRMLRSVILRLLLQAEADVQAAVGTGGREQRVVELARLSAGLDHAVTDAVEHFLAREIASRKRAEAALLNRETELKVAQRIAHVGSWSWIVGTGRLEASEEVFRIYGRDPSQPIPLNDSEELRRHYTPEGWERRAEAFRKALADGLPWERDEQILGLDGTVRWVHFRGEVERDEGGRIVKLRGTIQDVSDRKRAEEALREADRRKDEFLGMLSHELRNPLAPIRNSIYILEHAEAGSPQVQRAHAVIRRQTQHLTRLVDDLLDVTRIARGKIELRRTRVDLREVVLRAAEDFRLFEERGVSFHTAVGGAALWADADATRLTQVIGNLLHNAAKFTSPGDEVILSLEGDGRDAEIRVRDTGAGIDRALLPHVFEAFVQGPPTLARTDGGLGLGLALVKGIAELHGGGARAESAGQGQGTTFVVRLPLVAGATAPEPRRGGDVRAGGGRRVLVVDDNHDMAESLADLVLMLGHQVDVAYDGPSALAKARASAPDVVLCDLGLPGMSGYEVALALRGDGSAAVLIALSGYAQPEDVRKAIEAGFDVHVAKPADPDHIERLLTGREER
jgi:signal transduction histidine kinase